MNKICGDWWAEKNWEISIWKESSKESVIDYKYSHTAIEAPTKKWNLLPHPMNTSWLYNLFSWAGCIRNDIVQISSLDLAAFALGPGAIPSPCEQAQASHLEDERPFEGGPQWFQPSQMRPQICEGANWK